jgi:hypothetical protein
MQRVKVETLDDNIYYDISIVNNTPASIPTVINQTLNNNIVDNPQNYYLSCIRFFIDSSALPIFLFQNNAYYVSITNTATSTTSTQPVVYVPPYNTPESSPQGIYSYQDFIDMINTALALANAGAGTGLAAPYLYYDCSSGLISLFAVTAFNSTIPNPNLIYFNATLYYFFDNFNIFYQGEGRSDKLDIQLIVKEIGVGQNTSAIDPSIPGGYYRMSQEYVALNRWRGPSSIALKSHRLGIRNSYTTGANNSTNQNSAQTSGFGLPTDTVVTDFIPYIASNDAAGWRGNLVYTPTSQYRLLDLLSPVTNAIDISFWWRDQQNNEYPMENIPGSQSSIKLIFVKKSLYKNFLETGKITT